MMTIIFGLDAAEALAITVRRTPCQRSPATEEPAGYVLLTHGSSWSGVLTENAIMFLLLLRVEKGQRPFLPVQPQWMQPPAEVGDTTGEGRCFAATTTSSQAAQSESWSKRS